MSYRSGYYRYRDYRYGYGRHGFYRSAKAPLVLLVVAGYLLAKTLVLPAAILLAVALLKLVRSFNLFDPKRPLRAAINADATRHGVRVPADPVVWQGLETLYVKRRRAAEAFPTLAADYDEVLTSLWLELSQETHLHGWQRTIQRVTDQWTGPWPAGEGPLDASLGKLRRATTLWREAQKEAAT